MIIKIYIIILSYFIFGAFCGMLASRKKDSSGKKEFWLKFGSYLIIINLLYISIVIHPVYFNFLSVLIILAGFIEIIKLFINSGFILKRFFIISIFLYTIISTGFYLFGFLKMELILYTFMVLSVFDAFSQISGQLFGKRKMLPVISPNKTIEGFIGGSTGAILTSLLFTSLLNVSYPASVFYGTCVIISAFSGDMFASYYKRKYKAKDFSKALPGQGGFLDRFDSLIAGGSIMYLLSIIT